MDVTSCLAHHSSVNLVKEGIIVDHDITKEEVIEALEDAGLDEENIRWDYSGRGMFNETCFGFTGSDSDLIQFAIYLARLTPGRDLYWMSNFRSDSLGMDTIYYWPGISFEEDD